MNFSCDSREICCKKIIIGLRMESIKNLKQDLNLLFWIIWDILSQNWKKIDQVLEFVSIFHRFIRRRNRICISRPWDTMFQNGNVQKCGIQKFIQDFSRWSYIICAIPYVTYRMWHTIVWVIACWPYGMAHIIWPKIEGPYFMVHLDSTDWSDWVIFRW